MCDSADSTEADGNKSLGCASADGIPHGASTSLRSQAKDNDCTQWLSLLPQLPRKITKMSNDLIEECKNCTEDSSLSKELRDELESYSREVRYKVVSKLRSGCAPLFIVSKRGCVPIAEYLVTVCNADVEQRGLYEVPEERTFHCVTPLWCAVVSGKLSVVRYLIHVGCDINATSDSGSTPVRSACFMTHIDIVKYLVEHGADIKKPNINGGTCLINSVQSTTLCLYLIQKGADVNAKDIQDKTALHYAIQEHRLETTKLLLEHGANPFAKSRYGDDALRTACLKGAHLIFDYLINNLNYDPERKADGHELLGSTLLEEHNQTRMAGLHWRLAYQIRACQTPFLEKHPICPRRAAYNYAQDFTTLEELDNILADVDAMRMQSLVICERILGIEHKDTLYRLMFRGASYADSLQMQRCIDMWRLLLEVRVNTNTILHHDTSYTAQALVCFMLDIYERNHSIAVREQNAANNDLQDLRGLIDVEDGGVPQNRFNLLLRVIGPPQPPVLDDEFLPQFEDVYAIFQLLTQTLPGIQQLLQIRPVYRKQQEVYDRILKCVTHLIYILNGKANTFSEKRQVYFALRDLVEEDIRTSCTKDTLLHLCVSRLNIIRSVYITDESHFKCTFPNACIVKLFLDCGIDVNAKNIAKSTPLHIAAQPFNFNNTIVRLLLDYGAELDHPNKTNDTPLSLITKNSANTVPLMNYVSLKCISATAISKYKIPYQNQLPKFLEQFVKQHES